MSETKNLSGFIELSRTIKDNPERFSISDVYEAIEYGNSLEEGYEYYSINKMEDMKSIAQTYTENYSNQPKHISGYFFDYMLFRLDVLRLVFISCLMFEEYRYDEKDNKVFLDV
jgi:hypothetical protein